MNLTPNHGIQDHISLQRIAGQTSSRHRTCTCQRDHEVLCCEHTPAKHIIMFCASNFRCFAFPVTFAKRSESADIVENARMTLTMMTRSFRLLIVSASPPDMIVSVNEDPGAEGNNDRQYERTIKNRADRGL